MLFAFTFPGDESRIPNMYKDHMSEELAQADKCLSWAKEIHAK